MNHWLVLISLLLANDVEKNPGPLRSPEKRKSKLRRNKSVVRDSGVSSAGSASPTLVEDGRKGEEETPSPDTTTVTPPPPPPPPAVEEADRELDEDRMKVLQSEISCLQVGPELCSLNSFIPSLDSANKRGPECGETAQLYRNIETAVQSGRMEVEKEKPI